MTEKQTIEFQGIRFRPATEADLPLIADWIKDDEVHAGKIEPEHFIEQQKLVDCYAIEDSNGTVMFLRLDRAVRCTIQFGPHCTAEERERTRDTMQAGFQMLEVLLAQSGTREVIFDSQSTALRAFCTRTLGFRPKADTLAKQVPRIAPPA